MLNAAAVSDRNATQLFEVTSGGYALHRIRRFLLTHAEAGEDTTLIRAMSHHASLRTLMQHAHHPDAATAKLADRHDPNRRRC